MPDYPVLTGIGKLSGSFKLDTLPGGITYSDITIRAYYIDPLGGRFNGIQAAKVNCQSTGQWLIEDISEYQRYNVVISIPGYNDIIYSNKATSDAQDIPLPSYLPTTIGEFTQGGYYIGDIKDQGQMYKVLVAPIEADVYGLQWKTSNSPTSGTDSLTDGWSNTQSMNDGNHPAASHCLDYRGGDYDDWYMPAKDELNLFWLNIAPGKTQVPEFQSGGEQALHGSLYYWASTQYSLADDAWFQRFSDGSQTNWLKLGMTRRVRPVRRLPFYP